MAVAGATLVSDQALVAAELRLCRRDGRQTDGVIPRQRPNAEAQRSAASKRAAWLARGVGLSRASRDACRALPGDAGLRCKASACSMHHACERGLSGLLGTDEDACTAVLYGYGLFV